MGSSESSPRRCFVPHTVRRPIDPALTIASVIVCVVLRGRQYCFEPLINLLSLKRITRSVDVYLIIEPLRDRIAGISFSKCASIQIEANERAEKRRRAAGHTTDKSLPLGRLHRRRRRRVRRGPGSVPALPQAHAAAPAHRAGVRAAPGPAPRERPARTAGPRRADAGAGGPGRDSGRARHVYVIPPNTSLTLERGVLRLGPRLPQPEFGEADRRLPGLSGPGLGRTRRRHHPVRHRQRRHRGPARHQGARRNDHRPAARVGRLRRHAAERHRRRPGRLRPAPGRDAGAAGRVRSPDGASLRSATRDGAQPEPAADDAIERICDDPAPQDRARLLLPTSATPSSAESTGAWMRWRSQSPAEYLQRLEQDPKRPALFCRRC